MPLLAVETHPKGRSGRATRRGDYINSVRHYRGLQHRLLHLEGESHYRYGEHPYFSKILHNLFVTMLSPCHTLS